MFLWTRRKHYWQPHWKKLTKTKNFTLSVPKRKKKFKIFFRKIYLPNCSCKHVESSSGSPASFFLTKGRNFFTQCPEMIKNFDGFFLSTLLENLRLNAEKHLLSVRELKNLSTFSSKKTFQYDPMDTSKAVFTTLPKSFRQMVENFSLISEKKTKAPTIFSKNLIFFLDFLWTRRFQFWQPCSKYFDQKLKKFAQKTKLIKKFTFPLKKTFVKMFLGTRRIQFLQQKKLCSLSINDREKFFSKNSPQNESIET